MNKKSKAEIQFNRDLGLVFISIILAIIIAKTGTVRDFLTVTSESEFFGAFIAGLFFTSIFTTAPAIVILGELAQTISPWQVALVGGFGALLADLLIFRFFTDHVSEDIKHVMRKYHIGKRRSIFRSRLVRWFIPFLGALVIASPLPDELGIALLGFAKFPVKVFMLLSFVLNFAGILAIGLIARSL